jgi:glucokinase-like ROK family protein
MLTATFQGSNINLVKLHNLQVILLNLLYTPCLSRVQLAEITRLSNTTITNLISELIQQGLVAEEIDNLCMSEEPRPVGRPRTAIRLEPNARYVVGIHIGVGVVRVAVTNLRDEILENRVHLFDTQTPVDEVLNEIAGCANSVIASSQVDRSKILGVGVGASGRVDFQTGINILAPNLNWHNVPLKETLQEALGLPVVVDNNVRCMAIGETYFGAGQGVDSLAFVYGRKGVGAGLTYRGQVFRGSATGAGEIGHTVLLLQGGEKCQCGNSGCLETLVSEEVIIRLANHIAQGNPSGILAKMCQEHPDIPVIETIFNAAKSGDKQVCQMLEKRAYYLGLALANLVNLFNPELIILGGIFSQGQDLFLEPTIQTVREMAFGRLGESVRIQGTSFGWKAGVMGAAALALTHFFYQPEQTINS